MHEAPQEATGMEQSQERRLLPRADALATRIYSVTVRDGGGREWSGFVSNLSFSGACFLLLGVPRAAALAGNSVSGRIVGAGLSARFDGRLVWQREDNSGTVRRTAVGLRFSAISGAAATLLEALGGTTVSPGHCPGASRRRDRRQRRAHSYTTQVYRHSDPNDV